MHIGTVGALQQLYYFAEFGYFAKLCGFCLQGPVVLQSSVVIIIMIIVILVVLAAVFYK